VIASGGAGEAQHLVDAVVDGHADAVLVAGILHDGLTTVAALKDVMQASGLPVRATRAMTSFRGGTNA
jgi:cyclase